MKKIRQDMTKKVGLSAMFAAGLAAATIGLAGPAAAAPEIDIPTRHVEYSWHGDIGHHARGDAGHDVGSDIRQDIRPDLLHRVHPRGHRHLRQVRRAFRPDVRRVV